MRFSSLLIANRGEIAVRIARTARDMGLRTVAIYSDDDRDAPHCSAADEARPLNAAGVAAYLDIARIIATAKAANCEAIHPGYGFLSENAQFARACTEAGITFIGPSPEVLDSFGDKAKARALAERYGVPVLPATKGATTLDEARAFLKSRNGGAIMIKAIAGGGGRGMRAVTSEAELAEAYERCRSEARASFGNDSVYVEAYMKNARHIEIQVAGDGKSASHIWDRDCSLQRRNQKIVEIGPAPALDPDLRQQLCDAAVWLADDVRLRGLATVEFLIDPNPPRHAPAFAFIECNPRLQVEHTVTEAITGMDLVAVQIELARGHSLSAIGLRQVEVPRVRGAAIELRINMERIGEDGTVKPTGGVLARFVPPTGPGIRVDTGAAEGYTPAPGFDPLLAKLIVHAPDHARAVIRAKRALEEFQIVGIDTNAGFLHALLSRADLNSGKVHSRFVEENLAALLTDTKAFAASRPQISLPIAQAQKPARSTMAGPEGSFAIPSPLQGKLVSLSVGEGDLVRAGASIAVLEAMKMEHVITAPRSGRVVMVPAQPGHVFLEDDPMLFLAPEEIGAEADKTEAAVDPDYIRPDLAEVIERHGYTLDENRPDAVARRRKQNSRTARENLADLVDPNSFIEYGALGIAAQRTRRSIDDLIRNTPGDGLITGVGTVNGKYFDEEAARTAVFIYDYTVLAGTQGTKNHRKMDRLLARAEQWKMPIIMFAEGGGGRPGDVDVIKVSGLDTPTFRDYGRLSGIMPRIAIVSGRCFAGNASLAGSSDVLIATENSNIGMGGPAMIEGGGLGVYKPEDVGPIDVQDANGVVDIRVKDEVEGVAAAKKYLSYFQGPLKDWKYGDARALRHIIPENRLRIYDVRKVIAALADIDSVQEIRAGFAPGMITAFIRIEGKPFGLYANNPMHLAGAIDSDGADKAARFLQLCDAFGLPVISLCDTPGIMVGPENEKTAIVRKSSRLFVIGTTLQVPLFTIILRKAYGLGAQGMAGGAFTAPFFIVSWPTGELGPMGLEGAVRLGFKKELDAAPTPEAQERLFLEMVAQSYEKGKALNVATHTEIDDVIDPADTRRWLLRGLAAIPPITIKRRVIDTW